jgi:hypothetical protein
LDDLSRAAELWMRALARGIHAIQLARGQFPDVEARDAQPRAAIGGGTRPGFPGQEDGAHDQDTGQHGVDLRMFCARVVRSRASDKLPQA